MQVILLEKIRGVGNLGEAVEVKPGYARNFLIPKNKAVFSTTENLKLVEQRRAELEAKADQALVDAKTRAEKLAGLKVTIAAHSSDEGKLFGSVGVREISIAITEAGVSVTKQEIRLGEGPIRTIGEHVVAIGLHSDVVVDFTVTIVAE